MSDVFQSTWRCALLCMAFGAALSAVRHPNSDAALVLASPLLYLAIHKPRKVAP